MSVSLLRIFNVVLALVVELSLEVYVVPSAGRPYQSSDSTRVTAGGGPLMRSEQERSATRSVAMPALLEMEEDETLEIKKHETHPGYAPIPPDPVPPIECHQRSKEEGVWCYQVCVDQDQYAHFRNFMDPISCEDRTPSYHYSGSEVTLYQYMDRGDATASNLTGGSKDLGPECDPWWKKSTIPATSTTSELEFCENICSSEGNNLAYMTISFDWAAGKCPDQTGDDGNNLDVFLGSKHGLLYWRQENSSEAMAHPSR